MTKSVEELIINDLEKTGLGYDAFNEKYSFDKKQVKEFYEDLKGKGYNIQRGMFEGEVKYWIDNAPKGETLYVPKEQVAKEFSLGLMADPHLCDKACRLDALNSYYDIIQSRKIKYVLCAGDIFAGINVYPGQSNDLICWGLEEQLKYVIENYPKRKGVITETIGGNHDYSFTKTAGVDPLRLLANERDDIKYFGMYNCMINLGGIEIELEHLKKNPPYAVSYPGQKYVERRAHKPNILLLGHRHTTMYLYYAGVHIFEGGTFQGSNTLSKELGFNEFIAGWIVNITQEDGVIKKIVPELVSF
jgi:hypothetical protein